MAGVLTWTAERLNPMENRLRRLEFPLVYFLRAGAIGSTEKHMRMREFGRSSLPSSVMAVTDITHVKDGDSISVILMRNGSTSTSFSAGGNCVAIYDVSW